LRRGWMKYWRRVDHCARRTVNEGLRALVPNSFRNRMRDVRIAAEREATDKLMRKTTIIAAAAFVALLCVSCGDSKKQQEQAQPVVPAIPAEYQSAAEHGLGSDTDVLLYGDLAKNGHVQILAANRIKVTPQGAAPGTLVTRAALLENDNGSWKEIFRCDEHLQNTKGFLGGIPLAPVNGWRLQVEQDVAKGLEMYFTPIQKPAGGYVETIGVRWNPKVERYESMDRKYEVFLTEIPALETPQSQIR
jgi:hypothetical protein